MQKKLSNNTREPRRGALVVSILLIVITVVVAVVYFISAPDRNSKVYKVDKAETHPAVTKIPLPPAPPTVAPPVVQQKPTTDRHPSPKPDSAPSVKKPAADVRHSAGRLAIIIDDMGSSMSEARSLAAIGIPLTFSIIPGLRSYREVAQFAGSKGIETMLHIPMQSKGWPERRLEANGLLVSMDDAELKERVAAMLRDLPGVRGVNNHMGSEFMEHEDKVQSLMETLKKRNIFFVDSVTSPKSAGLRLAREMGIKSERRQVFLDNSQERGYILGQLGQAVKLAQKNGYAIAICHPHPETIATLASALPGLSAKGITLVPVSHLVR